MKRYTVAIYRGGRGYYTVEVPQLPGCISQGKTKASALRNIREAIELYLESLEAHKERLPRVELIEVSLTA